MTTSTSNPPTHTPGPYIIGKPGGPSGPFWSVMNQQGSVVAMQITSEANAKAIVQALELHNFILQVEREHPEAKAQRQRETWEDMPEHAMLYADFIGSVWLDPDNKLVVFVKEAGKFEAQLPDGIRIQRRPGTKVVGQS